MIRFFPLFTGACSYDAVGGEFALGKFAGRKLARETRQGRIRRWGICLSPVDRRDRSEIPVCEKVGENDCGRAQDALAPTDFGLQLMGGGGDSIPQSGRRENASLGIG